MKVKKIDKKMTIRKKAINKVTKKKCLTKFRPKSQKFIDKIKNMIQEDLRRDNKKIECEIFRIKNMTLGRDIQENPRKKKSKILGTSKTLTKKKMTLDDIFEIALQNK